MHYAHYHYTRPSTFHNKRVLMEMKGDCNLLVSGGSLAFTLLQEGGFIVEDASNDDDLEDTHAHTHTDTHPCLCISFSL